jgi:hypothetical protein
MALFVDAGTGLRRPVSLDEASTMLEGGDRDDTVERASILEFDGGYSRALAERKALAALVTRRPESSSGAFRRRSCRRTPRSSSSRMRSGTPRSRSGWCVAVWRSPCAMRGARCSRGRARQRGAGGWDGIRAGFRIPPAGRETPCGSCGAAATLSLGGGPLKSAAKET